MRPLLALLAVVTLACRTAAPPAPPADARVEPRLEALFADLDGRGLFSGAVVVGDRTRTLWARGYGMANVELGVPFGPDTPADSGSLAKTMTAALVLALHAEGRLNLDAPAQVLLPELPYPDVTLRHLLSHTSGVPVLDYDYFDAFLGKDEPRTTERLLAVLHEQRPALFFAPGTRFEYSSLGFDFAALGAARAAGRPFGVLLKERVFEPLGMGSPFLRPMRLVDFPPPRTLGYRRGTAGLEVHDVFDNEGFHGGSNIYISARDLHAWNAAFLGGPLLDAATRSAVERRATIGGHPSGLTLGSWYSSQDGDAFWYPGHLQGFHNVVYRNVRRGTSVAYVSNNTLAPWLQHAVVRAVEAIREGRHPGRLEPPAMAPIADEERPSLAGRWKLADGDALTIERNGSRLDVRRDGVAYRMVGVGGGAFYVPGQDLVLWFTRGPEGTLSEIHVSTQVALLRGRLS